MITTKSYNTNLFRLILLLGILAFALLVMGIHTAGAVPNTLQLSVISARTEPDAPGGPVLKGDPVSEYKYLINVDNTGDPGTGDPITDGCSVNSPGYPDSCDWPSVREVPGAAPIFTQGDQDDFNGVLGSGITLPNGKYLISVLADGYKMSGIHITVPLEGPVTVEAQPHPLPSATMRIRVFEDISPINGQFDAPGEFGLPDFFAIIKDPAGDVTTDVFGNPLCTTYLPNGDIDVLGTFEDCLISDANGDIVIPNLGPNRYDVEVAPPAGEGWLHTSTLEGSWSWDSWLAEGGTGLDNEFVVAGEPFPWTQFGFVKEQDSLPAGPSGGVSGTIVGASIYLPQQNGLPYQGGVWGGLNGTKVTGPIEDAWVALSNLQNGDSAVYVGPANPDGTFFIPDVPDGNYLFTWWDERLHYILDWTQITVSNGEVYDMGAQQLTGWFTKIEGYVFEDLNKNGVKDGGEPGLANYLVGLRDRDNSEIDRMSVAVTTDSTGYYVFERAYPMGAWMVLEAYNDRFYTTGITYQVENQPAPTTILGNGVDVGVLPILGQGGRLDWSVHQYEAGTKSYARTVLDDGPLHYYRLGEANTADPAIDVTGGNNGTYGSAVTLSAPGLLANSANTAAGFDGTATSYVDTGVTSLSASAFSIEAWVNAADTVGQHRIVVKDEIGVTGSWLLWFNQGKLRFQVRNSTNTAWVIAEAPTTPLAGDTFHVVGVFDGADAILYLDGAEVARTALGSNTANTNTLPITIGADSDPINPRGHIFDGTIDEVAIYEKALSAARIQAHFAAANAADTGPSNGGIVGSVFYEVTRNELDSQYEAVEPWSVGIPGLTMNLYATVACGTNTGTPCDGFGHELDTDGSLKKGPLLNVAETETWIQPVDCTARDANGVPLPFPAVQEVLAPYSGGFRCLEGPLMGTQFQSGFAELDGNWGFGEILNHPITGAPLGEEMAIPAGDYLVEVVIPEDTFGRPKYELVREETVNIFGGDQYVPAVPPPSCAGALHTVDVAGVGIDGYPQVDLGNGVVVTASIPYINPSFADPEAGGSPYEGTQMPLCDVKLVNLGNGKSIAPTFNLFTEVPIPGKWKGYIIDDLALSFDKTSLTFGEKAGLANAPIGIYDFNNRLVTTITSDYNGTYEVLLPSTHSVNCPSPSGVCASMYYLQGNDPGQPGAQNPNYNPQYRTIGATFEIWSGQMLPSDLAPTQMVIGVLNPSTTQTAPADCGLQDTVPQLFTVSQPYLYSNGAEGTSFTIQGLGFGNDEGQVTLGETPLPITDWNDTEIIVEVPLGFVPTGMYQLEITNAAGVSTINSLTFHYLGSGYNPQLYKVGPGRTYSTVQAGIDAASSFNGNRGAMVVVYPDTPVQWNPTGAYFENLIINQSIKLQGVGPGGPGILGSVIDGRGVAGDTAYADAWRAFVATLDWAGNQNIYEGPVVYYLPENETEFESDIRRQSVIDGFTITGGDQQGFPGPLAFDGTLKEALAVQGGGIFANGYARYLQITNNMLQSNGGAYGGAIRLGTPHLPGLLNDNQNDNVRIANNRIHSNGGTNLAGAIGIFSGAEGYEVAHNDICGNFSAEYGGGISHYGLSPNGAIHHNRVYFNRAYDEGGGIMIAGELPPNPAILSAGAGPVDVYANLIQANLGNDDGGGLRFLQAGNFPYNVYNNIIVNNISSHEGGGVSLNDAPDVRFYNNTVMKNITTATAVTSNGSPAPAGLSSSRNSATLQATLPGGSDIFSNPLLFNNIFWDNRAGSWTGGGIAGIGQPGDMTPIYNWDLGVADGTGNLSPTNSLMQVTTGTNLDGSNVVGSDPTVVDPFEVSVQVLPWRGNANFVDPLIVALKTRVDLLGDFHLASGSPAIDLGAPAKAGINAPADDFDGELRPVNTDWDSGADEFGGSTAPPNQPPTASFTFACNGLDCTYDASTSSDLDGTIVTYAWDFGDGSPVDNTSGVNAMHTYAAPGSYNVQLTVTDDGSVPANDVIIQEVVVSDATDMHVGDLDPDFIIIRPGQNNERWDAIVTITVHDATHLLPVEGAAVSLEGTRTNSNNNNVSTGSFTCTTAADGTCQVSWRINPFNFEDSVTFTVLDVTHASLTYVAGANHDPDGDSNGTTIVVQRQ